ncbi:pyocin activator PrtN family protein [Ruegeria atlantica]|uniref:pyocin activator PrtN family protein n=1 Tax=Ruegeria atlantica TaxID=81569 RepID=UPI00147F9C60|nr:pyocin activator PrtN family protein [Ruegeria atlantica]
MDTRFLLLARYNGLPIIPLEQVRDNFFQHLSLSKLLRKINGFQVALPLIRTDLSQKSHRGVHIEDLANCLDERREKALREFNQFHS